LRFNGRSEQTQRLPNTCNVSFIANEKFKGFEILTNVRVLQASTGACCHSGKNQASKILIAMGLDEAHALNTIRISVGRETTKLDVDIVIEDIKKTLNFLNLNA
jgi:cysteine sulfinate desulfinase/cysteine desulfurase-like protein